MLLTELNFVSTNFRNVISQKSVSISDSQKVLLPVSSASSLDVVVLDAQFPQEEWVLQNKLPDERCERVFRVPSWYCRAFATWLVCFETKPTDKNIWKCEKYFNGIQLKTNYSWKIACTSTIISKVSECNFCGPKIQ